MILRTAEIVKEAQKHAHIILDYIDKEEHLPKEVAQNLCDFLLDLVTTLQEREHGEHVKNR